MKLARVVLAASIVGVLIFGLPACGEGDDDGGGGGVGGSCVDYNGTVECLEYTGVDWTESTAAIHCQGMQGTHSSADCPTEGALGRCTISSGDPLQYYHVYYERLVEAEAACASNNGVWELL